MTDTALLRSVRLRDGAVVDVRLQGGVVAEVGSLAPSGADSVVDLRGWLLLPALCEPHVHPDKAFTATGSAGADLAAAMREHEAVVATQTPDDVAWRTERLVRRFLANGTTAIRCHVGCGRLAGVAAVDAVAGVRERLSGVVDLQIVAHLGGPERGTSWREHARVLEQAIHAGADMVGGNPFSEDDPEAAMRASFDVALEHGRGVDFHMDETTDANVQTIRSLTRRISTTAGAIPVTASHCISLGSAAPSLQAEIASELAAAGVSVVTLPMTSLYLQDRPTGQRRGLTALTALERGKVNVAAGSDNIQDAFNPVGRCDPLEVASLLVTAGHRSVDAALSMVSTAARAILRLPAAGVHVGAVADLVAVRCGSVAETVAQAPAERMVWKAGRLVSVTSRSSWIACSDAAELRESGSLDSDG